MPIYYITYGREGENEGRDKNKEEYCGKGYVRTDRNKQIGEVGVISGNRFDYYQISDEYISYLEKIKKLCDENSCEMIIVIPPLPYATMVYEGDYQKIINLYDSIASTLNVSIFKFDLAKPELLTLEDDDFYDGAHMSGKGSEKFSIAASNFIKSYINGDSIDNDRYFYSSYDELLNNSPYIFNTWLEKIEEDFIANSTYGNGVTPEYSFEWSDNGGVTWNTLREYSEDTRIASSDLPEGCNALRVMTRPKDSAQNTTDYQQEYILKL